MKPVMDLRSTPEQDRLRDECRTWLRANLPWEYGKGLPPHFDDLAEEVAFLREWQGKLADARLGRRHVADRVRRSRRRAPRPLRRAGGAGTRSRARARRSHRHQPRRPDDARPRHRRAEATLATGHPSGRAPVVPALQRARGGKRPGRRCAREPPRSTAAGTSTARRCGPRTRSSPTGACCSPAPTPMRRSTRASAPSRSTCASPGWRSDRCARSPTRPTSTRCSSTRRSWPTTS